MHSVPNGSIERNEKNTSRGIGARYKEARYENLKTVTYIEYLKKENKKEKGKGCIRQPGRAR
jgi:hypothetical protein